MWEGLSPGFMLSTSGVKGAPAGLEPDMPGSSVYKRTVTRLGFIPLCWDREERGARSRSVGLLVSVRQSLSLMPGGGGQAQAPGSPESLSLLQREQRHCLRMGK